MYKWIVDKSELQFAMKILAGLPKPLAKPAQIFPTIYF